jgi:hypothetical protein
VLVVALVPVGLKEGLTYFSRFESGFEGLLFFVINYLKINAFFLIPFSLVFFLIRSEKLKKVQYLFFALYMAFVVFGSYKIITYG